MARAVLAAVARQVWPRGAAGTVAGSASVALAFLLSTVVVVPTRAQEATATAPSVDVIVPAKLRPIKNQPDISDYYLEPRDRDALVYVRLDLTAAGVATNVEVVEGGFHDEGFAAAAKAVAKQLKFFPASRNGVPEESKGLVMPIRFNIHNATQITPAFRSELAKVSAFVSAKDFAGAHFHAQWMLSEKVKSGFEYAVLQATLADTHARVGNIHRALVASRNATAVTSMLSEQYIPGGPIPARSQKDFILSIADMTPILKLRYMLAVSQGLYLEALQTHATMQALNLHPEADPALVDFKELLNQVLTAPRLEAKARIDEDKIWRHDLSLRSFTVTDVRGELTDIEIRCEGQNRKLDFKANIEILVPPKWNNCSARFSGSPGAEFKIVEFRDTAKN
jgi:TonB family protein